MSASGTAHKFWAEQQSRIRVEQSRETTGQVKNLAKIRKTPKFPLYINNQLKQANIEELELSVRSLNCLRRAGFTNIGALVEKIYNADDLRKLRNCGITSADEIMHALFLYQYNILSPDEQTKYLKKVLMLNK